MLTIQEIIEALPNLSNKELHHIEKGIHNLYRIRNIHIIYDDDYGFWTEHDQNSLAAEISELLDREEN